MSKIYRIVESNTRINLENAINQLIMDASDTGYNINLLGGMISEFYPDFPPKYYQTLIIENNNPQLIPTEPEIPKKKGRPIKNA